MSVVSLLYQCWFSLSLFEIFMQVVSVPLYAVQAVVVCIIYPSDCICEVMCNFYCVVHWGFSGGFVMGWSDFCLAGCVEKLCFRYVGLPVSVIFFCGCNVECAHSSVAP